MKTIIKFKKNILICIIFYIYIFIYNIDFLIHLFNLIILKLPIIYHNKFSYATAYSTRQRIEIEINTRGIRWFAGQ